MQFYNIGKYIVVSYEHNIAVLNIETKKNVSCELAERLNMVKNGVSKRITDRRKNALKKVLNELVEQTKEVTIQIV